MERYALEAIQQLGYDFKQFTIKHFVHYVSTLTERDLVVSSHPFSDGVHGLWVNGKTRDYVFYNQNTHRIHKIHIVLHELGHIVLGHRGKKLPALLKELLVDLEQDGPPPYGRLHTSQITQDEDEHAAEWFVRCVQVELMQVERLVALTGPPSSLESVTRFARSLGYNG